MAIEQSDMELRGRFLAEVSLPLAKQTLISRPFEASKQDDLLSPPSD